MRAECESEGEEFIQVVYDRSLARMTPEQEWLNYEWKEEIVLEEVGTYASISAKIASVLYSAEIEPSPE